MGGRRPTADIKRTRRSLRMVPALVSALALMLVLLSVTPRTSALNLPRPQTNHQLNHHVTTDRPLTSTIVNACTSRRESLRRIFVCGFVGSSLALNSPLLQPANAAENDNDSDGLIDVYFGCGCFWHVQHEFVEAERNILNRNDDDLTARAGYAGGRAKDDLVCYHNARGIGDYGNLGHAEVVALRIPPSSFQAFAEEYFKLFDKDGNRPDQFGDRGPEYRNLVGVPGGAKSLYGRQLVAASVAQGDKLDFSVGKGDDRDARAVAFVMDTADFPLYIAEQYHQFHDGFNLNENYPNKYNDLASKLAEKGKLKKSMCPSGWAGLGGVGGL